MNRVFPHLTAKSLLTLPVATLAAFASALRGQQPSPRSGEDILREVHARYASSRFRTVSFVQKTTFPDGRVEWWYEAESIPAKARVDVEPFSIRNTSIFRNDSAYVWRNGTMSTRAGLAATMWTLMDMYAVPVEQTAAALRRRNFDLSKTHERTHNGRAVYVIGATQGDTTSAQFWVDKEHLYTVKMIVPTAAGRRVTDVGKHVFMDGGWIEQEIIVYLNGAVTLREEYTETKTNVVLPADFFEPDQYRTPHWPPRKSPPH